MGIKEAIFNDEGSFMNIIFDRTYRRQGFDVKQSECSIRKNNVVRRNYFG